MNIDKAIKIRCGGEFKQIPIKGLENYYCNKIGHIYSNSKKKGLLTSRKDKDGYLIITFACNKKRLDMKIHRVVALTFIGPCPKNFVCNHINAIKDDNRVENLEWISQKENYHHSKNIINNDYYNPLKWTGEKHGHTKLSDKQAIKIRIVWINEKPSIRSLARKYKVSESCIHRIVKNITYKYLIGKI